MNIELRDYQKQIADQATAILQSSQFVYLALEVRTGKTLTSLQIASQVGATSVLFVTKKKAIASIQGDYDKLAPGYSIEIVNYESLHKVSLQVIDMMILDESHCFSKFPKPSKRAKDVKAIIDKHRCKAIYLSGTPSPESYSQMYHQMWVLGSDSPFAAYTNFYKWAKDYVDIKQRKINSLFINDYSHGIQDKIESRMKKYLISFTQKEAGFESSVEEEILRVDMPEIVSKLCDDLVRDRVIEGKKEIILADTGAKLMQKLHQLCSGTIIFESGASMIVSDFKAKFIRERFAGKRIAIFYKFKAELMAIELAFGDSVTTDLATFQNGDCDNFAIQIVTGREGINLSVADHIVFYNIDFSATSYFQAKDRMTTKDRMHNKVYWVFTKGGIEEKIYKVVQKKKNFTISHFKSSYKLLSLQTHVNRTTGTN
jgi:hypothetical protein